LNFGLRSKHRQKLRVFQRITSLDDVAEWHGGTFARANFMAVLGELLFG
jgi:hypothetical protein